MQELTRKTPNQKNKSTIIIITQKPLSHANYNIILSKLFYHSHHFSISQTREYRREVKQELGIQA